MKKQGKVFFVCVLFTVSGLGSSLVLHPHPVHAQSFSFIRQTTINPNDRHSYNLYLQEGEYLVSWFRFISGEGIYVYIQNSTEQLLSEFRPPVSVHNATTFENDENEWHYWSFVAPYNDTWSICFSKWDSEPYSDSSCELEIMVGSWVYASNPKVFYPTNKVSRSFSIPFAVKSTDGPLDRVEIHIDEKKRNTHWLTTSSFFMYEGKFVVDTLDYENGNHTARVIAYSRKQGVVGEVSFLIQVSNEFFDNPDNVALVILLYGLFVSVIVVVFFPVQPTDEKDKWVKRTLIFATIGGGSMLIGGISYPGAEVGFVQSIFFLIGLTLLNIAILCMSYVLYAGIVTDQNNNQSNGKSSNPYRAKHSLTENQLLNRSDILDKTRGNIRTGTSFILAVGSGISWWFINQQGQLSILEMVILLASLGLAFFSLAALLISFSHFTSKSGELELGEHLIPEGLTKVQYEQQLITIIKMKSRNLSQIRQVIGIGILWFFAFGLVGVSLPIYFATTVASPCSVVSVATVIPLTIMFSAIVRFVLIVLGSHGLRIIER